MASNTQTSQEKGRMQLPPPANYLLSPPEEPALDSFSADVSPSPTEQDWSNKLPPMQLGPSPPTSPQTSPLPRLAVMRVKHLSTGVSDSQDPPLYPSSFARSDSTNESAPLFDSNNSQAESRKDSRKDSRNATPIKTYPLSGSSKNNEFSILKTLTKREEVDQYREALYQEIRAIHKAQREAREPEVALQLNKAFDKLTESKKNSVFKANTGAGVCKPQTRPQAKRQASPPTFQTDKPVRMTKPTAKTAAVTPRRAPKAPTVTKAATPARNSKSLSVEPSQPRKRAPPSKAGVPKAEDANWASQPDYCPPTSTLDKNPRTLRVTWKSPPNDLSNDDTIKHMHPQEIEIASALKLPGVQYMANKRRIFAMRLQCLQQDQQFGKTRAQGACNIDVNKTSQMFEAFERVGWFERKHFEKWLS